jgi:archaellum biogenesis ATPase FlaH
VSNYKGAMLLEADPSVNYERAVREFALEMVASGRVVFAFTSKGSPVYLQLKDIPGLRLFILSESSYPKPSPGSLEVLVPRSDYSVLLNVMDEAVTRSPEKAKALIFDSISSLILDAGFQECYKFLRQVNEILSHGDVVSEFLVLSKAHDDKMMNLIKNLYSGHLTYDAAGLHVTKKG